MILNPIQIPQTLYFHFIRLLFCCLFFISAVAAEDVDKETSNDPNNDPASQILSLPYRVALFDYYQQDYFAALSELMVADKQQTLLESKAESGLLQAGIQLSYGMDNAAEKRFQRLLNDLRSGEQRSRAWLLLANSQFNKGEYQAANKILQQQLEALPTPLQARKDYLTTNVALRDTGSTVSLDRIDDVEVNAEQRAYLLFNYSMKQLRQKSLQDAALAAVKFNQLDDSSKNYQALSDRLYINLGYAYLEDKSYLQAQQSFENVNLDSPLIHNALLGLGWSNFYQGKMRRAFSAWSTLVKGPDFYDSVQEGLVALSYLYESEGELDSALINYQQTEQRLHSALDRIEQLQAKVADLTTEDFIVLVDVDANSELSAEMHELFSANRFWHEFGLIEDLYDLQRILQQNSNKLTVLEAVGQDQLAAWGKVKEQASIDQLRQRLALQQSNYQTMQQLLQRAEQSRSGLELIASSEIQQWQLIQKAITNIEVLAKNNRVTANKADKARLLRGLAIWDASENYPERRWQLEKQLYELEAELATAQQRLARVGRAVAVDEGHPLLAEMSAMRSRLAESEAAVARASSSLEASLRSQMLTSLQEKNALLESYISRVKLAIARIADQKMVGQ